MYNIICYVNKKGKRRTKATDRNSRFFAIIQVRKGGVRMNSNLLRLYQQGKLTEQGLSNAVSLGWITQEQMEQILSTL